MTTEEYKETEKLIASVARHYAHRAEWNDLMQAGWVGALKAIQRYKPTGTMKLTTFKVWYIKMAIKKSLSTGGNAYFETATMPTDTLAEQEHTEQVDAYNLLKQLYTKEERHILLLYYSGYNYREIGEQYGRSFEWARKKIKALIENVEVSQYE